MLLTLSSLGTVVGLFFYFCKLIITENLPVKVGTNGDEKILLVPKCIELPTFFVYGRLNIPDSIHFSGTDFM